MQEPVLAVSPEGESSLGGTMPLLRMKGATRR